MRDLTKAELEEYFKFARADKRAGDFHLEQGLLIAETVVESGLIGAIAGKLQTIQDAEIEVRDVFLSLWVSAFQMGRECESRLLTAALKGRVDAQPR